MWEECPPATGRALIGRRRERSERGRTASTVATAVAEPTTVVPEETSASAIVGRSPSQLAWMRFRRDKTGMVALVMAILILLSSILAYPITKLLGIDPVTFHTADNRPDLMNFSGIPKGAFGGISFAHPLGLEPSTGRDVLARLLFGSQISFSVAFITTFSTLFLGLIIGIVSGYIGGRLDGIIGRIIDFLMSFPGFFMVIALSEPAVNQLQTRMPQIDVNIIRVSVLIIFLTFFGWMYFARLIRGQVLSMRERDFISAAIALGSPSRRIVFKEILPNMWPPVIVFASNALPGFLGAEAAFSFLGIGVQDPFCTWGVLLAQSQSYWSTDPTFFAIPGALLFLVVLSFNLVGDSVRDALDPKADR